MYPCTGVSVHDILLQWHVVRQHVWRGTLRNVTVVQISRAEIVPMACISDRQTLILSRIDRRSCSPLHASPRHRKSCRLHPTESGAAERQLPIRRNLQASAAAAAPVQSSLVDMPGQLFCLEDSYVRQCTAAVMSCSPVAVKKKGPKQWALQLSQTVLYAEGMHIRLAPASC